MRTSMRTLQTFKKIVWRNYHTNARAFPWRNTRNPYRIFVSEIMLQQTQAPRVVGHYLRFIKKFPNWKALARAQKAEVLIQWQGLGYNRRALNVKRAAEIIVTVHHGKLPKTVEQIDALPGVGRATACAVAAFAFDLAQPYLETNIRSAYLHYFFPRNKGVSDTQLIPLITQTLDKNNPREWFYALMDYGSLLKKSLPNPNRRSRHHTRQSHFVGSRRQVRGCALRVLSQGARTYPQLEHLLIRETRCSVPLAREVVDELTLEGFLSQKRRQNKRVYALAA